METQVNLILNWSTKKQFLKIVCLSFYKIIFFLLSLFGYYFNSPLKLIKKQTFKAILIWMFFLIYTIIFFTIQRNIVNLNFQIKQINDSNLYSFYSNNFLNYNKYDINSIWNSFQSQKILIDHLNQYAVAHSSFAVLIGQIFTSYLPIIIQLKVVFSFMVMSLIILFIYSWSVFGFIFLKIEISWITKILLTFDFLFNPFGSWLTWFFYVKKENYKKTKIIQSIKSYDLKLEKKVFKCYPRKNPNLTIDLWREIKIGIKLIAYQIYFWLNPRAGVKNLSFDFPKCGYDPVNFVEVKNLFFTYHGQSNWQKMEHFFLKYFSQQKYDKHLIRKNSLLHENAIYEKKNFTPVLNNVNLTIAENKFTVILGANGSGKSTVIKTLINQNKNYKGSIKWANQNLKLISLNQFSQNVAVIAQNNNFEVGTRVYDFVAYGRTPYLKMMSSLTSNDHQIIENVMKKTNIWHLANKMTNELSGGQKQKVLIAMALAQNTKVIILDEPTTYLDIKNQYELLEQLKSMHKENKTIIAILHDINQAIHYADEIILLKNGRVYDQGPTLKVITKESLAAVFGLNVDLVLQNGRYYIANMAAI